MGVKTLNWCHTRLTPLGIGSCHERGRIQSCGNTSVSKRADRTPSSVLLPSLYTYPTQRSGRQVIALSRPGTVIKWLYDSSGSPARATRRTFHTQTTRNLQPRESPRKKTRQRFKALLAVCQQSQSLPTALLFADEPVLSLAL